MVYFGLTRSPRDVGQEGGYFETDPHRRLLQEVTAAIHAGELVALVGWVGSGKTLMLERVKARLRAERLLEVATSHAVEKEKVDLRALMAAVYYELTGGFDARLPRRADRCEPLVMERIRRCGRPMALCIDDAHELLARALRDLDEFSRRVRQQGGRLSGVLAGQPALRTTLEETALHAAVFELRGIQGHVREYIAWLVEQCLSPTVAFGDMLTDTALDTLAERLATPLQVEHRLTLALEEAYRRGERRLTREVVETVLRSWAVSA
jgi:type II secretory pathway predicted ATPase ExeA